MDKRPSPKRWDTLGLTFTGVCFGWMLVVAHEAYDIFFERFDAKSPFVHMIGQLAGAGFVGALLFSCISGFRNLMVRPDIEQDPAYRKRQDVVAYSLIGALCGLVVGGAYELSEAYFHSPTGQESLAYMLVELFVDALGGALLFAVVAVIRNRSRSR
jgi:hypothetical protein